MGIFGGQRRIKGSRGAFAVLIVTCMLGAIALFSGKFVQDFFIGTLNQNFGLKPEAPKLPPNPANQRPQMN